MHELVTRVNGLLKKSAEGEGEKGAMGERRHMGAQTYHNELYHNEFTTAPTVNVFDDRLPNVKRSISSLRGSHLQCLDDELRFGKWNVQGQSDFKLVELQDVMIEECLFNAWRRLINQELKRILPT